MLNILIACDHISSRETLLQALSDQSLSCAVSLCADIYAAIAICEWQQPEIVIIDGSSDPLAAIEATKKITSCSAANVIAVSRQTDPDFASHMFSAGALGYLTTSSSAAQIMNAVTEVAKDNLYSCIDSNPLPVKTPEHISSFLNSLSTFRKNTREKMKAVTEAHWYGILKFTN